LPKSILIRMVGLFRRGSMVNLVSVDIPVRVFNALDSGPVKAFGSV